VDYAEARLLTAGVVVLLLGLFELETQLGQALLVDTSQASLLISLGLMGIGMGLTIPSFLIAVQSSVRRSALGTATSTLQFSCNMGGVLGVSVLGVVRAISSRRRSVWLS